MGRSLLPNACVISIDSPPNDWCRDTCSKPLPHHAPLFLLALLISAALLPPDNCGRIWQHAHEVSWPLSRLCFTWLFPHHISNLPNPLETQSQSWLMPNSSVLAHLWISLIVSLTDILQSFNRFTVMFGYLQMNVSIH